jgi:predicted transposase YdaD
MQIIRYKKNEFKTEFQKLIHKLLTEKDHTKKIEIFEEIVQYLFRAREDAEELTHKNVFKEVESDYMNLLERLEEKGRLEGKLEGKLEGRQEGELTKAIESARKMKEKRFSTIEILEITGLSQTQLIENGIL